MWYMGIDTVYYLLSIAIQSIDKKCPDRTSLEWASDLIANVIFVGNMHDVRQGVTSTVPESLTIR